MPQDTIWLDTKGSFMVIADYTSIDTAILKDALKRSLDETDINYCYNPKNSSHADSLFKELSKGKRYTTQTKFEKEVAYYDRISVYIELIILLAAFFLVIYAIRRAKKYKENPFDENENDWIEIGSTQRYSGRNYFDLDIRKRIRPEPKPVVKYYTYEGKNLKFTDEQIAAILTKRFVYFKKLSVGEKHRFLQRHKKFMQNKLFRIHTSDSFKEMPILLSATAIQFSFGLDNYLLPHYKNIHIFPSEFLGLEPSIRFLVGNVSKNNINIS